MLHPLIAFNRTLNQELATWNSPFPGGPVGPLMFLKIQHRKIFRLPGSSSLFQYFSLSTILSIILIFITEWISNTFIDQYTVFFKSNLCKIYI